MSEQDTGALPSMQNDRESVTDVLAKVTDALRGMVRRHDASVQNWTQAAVDAQRSGNRELSVSIQNTALTALGGFPIDEARAALSRTEHKS